MTLPVWTEVQLAIGGALRLAVGDRRGLGCFDPTIEGFWRSFRAGLLCYPIYLFLLTLRVLPAEWQASGAPTILIVETISYVISWVAFPLLMLPLTRFVGRDSRFLGFMVVYNWSQVPQMALFGLIGIDLATGLLSETTAPLMEVAAMIAVMVYEWYIARVTLAVTGAQAMLVVLIDLLLGRGLDLVARSLY